MKFKLVHQMQKKMGVEYIGPPRFLSEEEHEFRIETFHEEIQEYIDAATLEEKADGLMDLIIFALGAMAQHGFDAEEIYRRIMNANMFKELVSVENAGKRGYVNDFRKPVGWRAPYLSDLMSPTQKHRGLIVLDGPDGCGKTTLAEMLVNDYGAVCFHSTWSPELEARMPEYMAQTFDIALASAANQLVVLDRHFLSALVYADVFRSGATPNRDDVYKRFFSILENHQNARLVFCLPNDQEKQNAHFDSLSVAREEMYESKGVAEVFSAYAKLWHGFGRYTFKSEGQFHHDIIARGGYALVRNAVRYDWNHFATPDLLKTFCDSLVKPQLR